MTVDRRRADRISRSVAHDTYGAAAASFKDVFLGSRRRVPDRARLVVRRGNDFVSSRPGDAPNTSLVGLLDLSFAVEHSHGALVAFVCCYGGGEAREVAAAGEMGR